MSDKANAVPPHELWARLRFSIVGPLLAAPPERGELAEELKRLSAKPWQHPLTGKPVRFGFSTIQRWYYAARAERTDPVGVLRRKARRDRGRQPALNERLRQALLAQYRQHPSWSYRLHVDNLAVRVEQDPKLGPMPSYVTVWRFMKRQGLTKKRRRARRLAAQPTEPRWEQREVRSFEAPYTNALWHLDFHHGSRKVLTPQGEWVTPRLFCVLDDRSRLAGHVQWYLGETAEELVHGLCQAFAKRGLPRALMTDNGPAMTAEETRQGLLRLGIVHELTLPYSPYQNGKQEVFFAQVEGRLLAMLETCRELTLSVLNEATQAWVELEYHRTVHSETGESPLQRFVQGSSVGRDCPSREALRLAFCTQTTRRPRQSDGTLSLEGIRFELPGRFRHLPRVWVRYASWDLSHVYLVDERSGSVLSRLYPLDKNKNAEAGRRRLEPEALSSPREPTPAHQEDIAPLLRKLMQDYAASGLPPAYLPPTDSSPKEDP